MASLPSLGGSLLCLVAPTGQGKLSEEQDSAVPPRPALPLLLSRGPGQVLLVPGRPPGGGRAGLGLTATDLHSRLCSFSHLAKSPQELLPEGYLLRSRSCFWCPTCPSVVAPGKGRAQPVLAPRFLEMGGPAVSLRSSPAPPVPACLSLLATRSRADPPHMAVLSHKP